MMSLNKRVCSSTYRTYSRTKLLIDRQLINNNVHRQCLNWCFVMKHYTYKINSIKPENVKPMKEKSNVGAELTGELREDAVMSAVEKFFAFEQLEKLAEENDLSGEFFINSKISFKNYCSRVESLPSDLHILLFDIIHGSKNVLDLLPFFLGHANQVYPHLKFKDELSRISDMTEPINWYPLARSLKRKIIFHYGPTNSGKTYSALKRFYEVDKAVYCSPLKLLAFEIFEKCNKNGISCDLITGEENTKVLGDDQNANHVSCTVEMLSTNEIYDVAVIDEIQMLRDPIRGYAWTNALLGVAAKEVHLCGEESALMYIKHLAKSMNEEIETLKYERKTKLIVEDKALQTWKNVREGDCIVCFSRKDIYRILYELEKLGFSCAIIYGTLPPHTKVAQSRLFNENKRQVLIATDAVGLGINLNIRRIIFYSLGMTPGLFTTSQCLQIAGRAGRFQSKYNEGFVTTYKSFELPRLKAMLASKPDPLDQAGLFFTYDKFEMFSYYLPNISPSKLIDIFESIATFDDSKYFICDLSKLKELFELLEPFKLPQNTLYTFCCAPVTQAPMVKAVFTKLAKKHSMGKQVTIQFLETTLNFPWTEPKRFDQLMILEQVFDILDICLWLGYRFPSTFPDMKGIRDLQNQLAMTITSAISKLTKTSSETNFLSNQALEEEEEVLPEKGKKIETRLIQEGIISKALLDRLKAEWMDEIKKKGKDDLDADEEN